MGTSLESPRDSSLVNERNESVTRGRESAMGMGILKSLLHRECYVANVLGH
jgi:hypothetical protein